MVPAGSAFPVAAATGSRLAGELVDGEVIQRTWTVRLYGPHRRPVETDRPGAGNGVGDAEEFRGGAVGVERVAARCSAAVDVATGVGGGHLHVAAGPVAEERGDALPYLDEDGGGDRVVLPHGEAGRSGRALQVVEKDPGDLLVTVGVGVEALVRRSAGGELDAVEVGVTVATQLLAVELT